MMKIVGTTEVNTSNMSLAELMELKKAIVKELAKIDFEIQTRKMAEHRHSSRE